MLNAKPNSTPAPFTVSAKCMAWWDFSDPNANQILPIDLSMLNNVKDKSGNSYDLSQPTASLQFQFVLNGINSKPAAYLDGTKAMTSTLAGSSSKVTIFFVARPTVLSGLRHIYGNNGFGAGAVHFLADGTTLNLSVSTRTPNNAPTTANFTINNNYIVVGRDNNVTSTILINSITLANAAITVPANKTYGAAYVGAWNNGGLSRFFTGYFGEIIIYADQLSASDELLIRQYLSNKWGIEG